MIRVKRAKKWRAINRGRGNDLHDKYAKARDEKKALLLLMGTRPLDRSEGKELNRLATRQRRLAKRLGLILEEDV